MTPSKSSLIDHIDLMVDEFKRIRALNPSSEILGLCDRALRVTEKNVPVIEQRFEGRTDFPYGMESIGMVPLYTHPASAATLQFGNGNLVVTGGSFDDVPAVFISPAIDLGNAPGTALSGKDAERRTDMLYGDETVLLFKTAEHASVVAGALIRGNDASADEWIKCSEQTPNSGQRVILYSKGVIQNYMPLFEQGDSDFGMYEDFWDFEDINGIDNPLVNFEEDCWMPLPEPLKQEQSHD